MKVSCTKAEFPKEPERINPVIGRATNTSNDDTIQTSLLAIKIQIITSMLKMAMMANLWHKSCIQQQSPK